ncbi:heavy metal translocating P-type ATPase [Alteromonas sp. C1M14]|uniref:heavy metal translocating P-type ATPase n=1 Tax=Alteromonas sp. C1M14 TaxID=2841567 RepID=UPI00339D48B5
MTQTEHCYHCGEKNNPQQVYTTCVLGEPRPMCCPGCQAVAQAIVDNGLEDYYRFRTAPAAKGDDALLSTMAKLAVYDEPALQEEFVVDDGDEKQIELTLEGITCAACGWLIEKQLSKVKGIRQVSVNVAQRRAFVTWLPAQLSLSQIMETLHRIGYPALPFQPDQHEASYKKENKQFLKKLGLAGIMTMQVMMLAAALYFDWLGNMAAETRTYFHWVALTLTTPVVFYSGSTFYLGAMKALSAKTVNMDVPVSIAIFGTYMAGIKATLLQQGEVYFESICMFIFLLLLSRYLEHRSRHKAAEISANMMQYIPVTATKVTRNGEQQQVLAKSLQTDDVVSIKAGETVPIDGIVIAGKSTIDESMLTGEFKPAKKIVGDRVYGGTVNQNSTITVKVTNTLKNALVNQIIRLQSKAMASKPRVAQLADKLASIFVFAVLLIAASTFLIWHWLGNEQAFWITISVLVATCPCALGLATPSALTCAMAYLNRRGVLLKRADALEQLSQVDTVIFDKTGTLTEGVFAISQIWLAANAKEDHVLAIMASLEALSEHPIAGAFTHNTTLPVSDFTVHSGEGITGIINGDVYRVGTANYACLGKPPTLPKANVFISCNGHYLAGFQVADKIKDDAQCLVNGFSDKHRILLSGDIQENVSQVAQRLGINEAVGGNTPKQKYAFVLQRQQAGNRIMMLGDGINDAPVLAAADIAVAVGNATDVAKSAADVILLGDKMAAIPELFKLAKRVNMTIKQNMAWALGYNILVLPFAVSGVLTPWMAVIGMSLSSIIVVTNSTKLLK